MKGALNLLTYVGPGAHTGHVHTQTTLHHVWAMPPKNKEENQKARTDVQ